MKECPECAACQDDAVDACPNDGARLATGFPGDRVLDGKYRVDRRLGEGGMGLIYRARHLALQRNFALKLIQPQQAADSTFLARFRVEAEALGRLKHPNIVDVTDFGVDPREGGLPYLVMEYLEGRSLAERLRRDEALEPETAMPILDAVARAVDFAHSRGVLHRDLKPANVFLCDGQLATAAAVKVVDFGIARLLGPASTSGSSTQTTLPAHRLMESGMDETPNGLTAKGVVVGSVPYLPPEVLKEQPPTPASDVYSFGILVYQLLVGRLPFTGTLREVLIGHIREEPPPPSTLRDTLSSEFDRPILASLDKSPGRRPSSAVALVAGLRAASRRVALTRWRRTEIPRRAWLSAAVGLGLMAVSAFLWRSRAVETLERRTVDARFLSLPARAPDPRLLLVAIDDATLEADRTPLSQEADEFGQNLERALGGGAKAAAVDLLLPENWSRSRSFADLVLRHAPQLTLAALSSPSGNVVGPECVSGLIGAALGPARSSEIFGSVNLAEDSDGVIRQARLYYAERNGGKRATWAARAAATLDAQPRGSKTGNSPFWIDYSADKNRLARISWKDFPATIEGDPEFLKGRLLLVGATFAGGGDDAHAVPHRQDGDKEISGLLLQALIVNTLLEGVPYRSFSPAPAVLISGIVAGCVVFAVLSRARVSIPLGITVSLAAIYAAVAWVLFRQMGWILVLVGPTLTLAIAAMGALVLRRVLPRRPELEDVHS